MASLHNKLRYVAYLLFCLACAGKPFVATAQQRSLGEVNFAVSCSANAQGVFNNGVALLHHMMYVQAEQEFQTIAAREPGCAMAHWGIAMTQFHPLWAPPSTAELQKGKLAIELASKLKPATPREQAYIAATQAFYDDWPSKTHKVRIKAWQSQQEKVFKDNPDDIDAGAFYALSLLATAPKQDKTFKHQQQTGALLERLHKLAPKHPALFHYLIHAYDNPLLAHRAVSIAKDYDKLAPDVPHALHMPSHIFVRMGMWPEAIDWNIRSAAAAKAQSDDVMSLHYIHALDYLIYAYLQQGQYEKARKLINTVNRVKAYQDSFVAAYGIAAAQARYPLERADWQQAAQLPTRTHTSFAWDKYPQYEAITYYARGLGAARTNDIKSANKAQLKLNALYANTNSSGDTYWPVIVDAQRNTVAAWIAYAKGDKEKALQKMRKAADIEGSVDKHPVTPSSVLPAQDLLGDMLMLNNKHKAALTAYQLSLATSPNRAYSLYGAGYAAESARLPKIAKDYYQKFITLSAHADPGEMRVNHAKTFVQENQQ